MLSVFKGSEQGTALCFWTPLTILPHTKMSPYFSENFCGCVCGGKTDQIKSSVENQMKLNAYNL